MNPFGLYNNLSKPNAGRTNVFLVTNSELTSDEHVIGDIIGEKGANATNSQLSLL